MTSSYLMDGVNASTLVLALRNLLTTLGIEIFSGSTFNVTQYCKLTDINYTTNKWKCQVAVFHQATIQMFGLQKDFLVNYETQTTNARVKYEEVQIYNLFDNDNPFIEELGMPDDDHYVPLTNDGTILLYQRQTMNLRRWLR
ncbi:hypothetical protein MP228_012661 [Amoeboaphelidium protococcarum]|nr:hypothetical protein MP228_012661 [Amoeboaphelidium protococcarum]